MELLSMGKCYVMIANHQKSGKLGLLYLVRGRNNATNVKTVGAYLWRTMDDRRTCDRESNLGTCVFCANNRLIKGSKAPNGVQMWICKDCGRRFREIRTFGKGRKWTIEQRLQSMRILPTETLLEDYVDKGMPLVALAKKYSCRAKTARRCLVDHNIAIRNLSEQVKTEYTASKLGKANIGNLHTLGYKHTKETRMRMSTIGKDRMKNPEIRLKYTMAQKRLWNNIEHRNKQITAMMRGQRVLPNKPEICVWDLLEHLYPGEWKYVGDRQVIFDGKNPDFINVNGLKLIIEVFGNYWHQGEDAQ